MVWNLSDQNDLERNWVWSETNSSAVSIFLMKDVASSNNTATFHSENRLESEGADWKQEIQRT